MCTVLPVIAEPDLEIELETITPMNDGSGPSGGGGLLPGPVVQSVPQLGVDGLSAKPLKLAGASPPLSVLSFHHFSLSREHFLELVEKAPELLRELEGVADGRLAEAFKEP